MEGVERSRQKGSFHKAIATHISPLTVTVPVLRGLRDQPVSIVGRDAGVPLQPTPFIILLPCRENDSPEYLAMSERARVRSSADASLGMLASYPGFPSLVLYGSL